jgi:hypothetical protein
VNRVARGHWPSGRGFADAIPMALRGHVLTRDAVEHIRAVLTDPGRRIARRQPQSPTGHGLPDDHASLTCRLAGMATRRARCPWRARAGSIPSPGKPTDLAARLRGTTLFVSGGNGQPGPLDAATTTPDPIEQAIDAENLAFTARLRQLGIPATVDLYGDGTHNWPYWQREFHKAWPLLAQALGTN